MGGFRTGVFAAGLLAILSGCGQEADPIPFRLGQTIPLGALELEIVSFEAVPQVHAPISTLRTAPESMPASTQMNMMTAWRRTHAR